MRTPLLKATSIVSVLFLGFYGAFILLADLIHASPPPTDPAIVNRWIRYWVSQNDGAESYVMMVGVTGLLLLAFLVISALPRIRWTESRPLQVVTLLPALILIDHVRSTNITPLEGHGANLRVIGLALAVVVGGYVVIRLTEARPWARRLGLVGVWLVVALGVVMSAQSGNAFDYGFFVGPALKLAQGERLGSFYMQYNLIETSVFRLMMAFDLRIHQMQAVLSVVFALWLVAFHRLAARLFDDRFLVLLFLVALMVVRFFAIIEGPTFFPQVSTLRMDLWVLPALVLARCGFTSPLTSSAFALGYVADNHFGLLSFAFYGVALAASELKEWRAQGWVDPKRMVLMGAPLLGALVFQVWTFRSLTNPAGTIYQRLHLGFLPIEPQSMFWGVLWVLLAAIYPIISDPDPARRRVTSFLFAFAAAQLSYFYGRSHDHNLLNVSAILVLVFFVGLDRLRHLGVGSRWSRAVGACFVVLASVAAAQTGQGAIDRIRSRLARRLVIEPNGIDGQVDQVGSALAGATKEKVVLFGTLDAYANYRLHLRQVGFFAPLYAAVYLDETALYVRDLLRAGYRVVVILSPKEDLLDLNSSPSLRKDNQQFTVVQNGPLGEVRLDELSRRAGGEGGAAAQ